MRILRTVAVGGLCLCSLSCGKSDDRQVTVGDSPRARVAVLDTGAVKNGRGVNRAATRGTRPAKTRAIQRRATETTTTTTTIPPPATIPTTPPTMPNLPALEGDVPCGGDLPPCYVVQRESGGTWDAYNPTGCSGTGCWGPYQFGGFWAGKLGLPSDLSTTTKEQWVNAARLLWNHGAGCGNWAAC
jgi:hypothetical protein